MYSPRTFEEGEDRQTTRKIKAMDSKGDNINHRKKIISLERTIEVQQ